MPAFPQWLSRIFFLYLMLYSHRQGLWLLDSLWRWGFGGGAQPQTPPPQTDCKARSVFDIPCLRSYDEKDSLRQRSH
jgi:hypothetical protein